MMGASTGLENPMECLFEGQRKRAYNVLIINGLGNLNCGETLTEESVYKACWFC
jgi:hypothetical protein